METYSQLVRRATGREDADPYPWQQRVAAEGLPEVIGIETGAGKTEGVVLPWLWRRFFHPEPGVRAATARLFVLCLPLRVLTAQVEGSVRGWVEALGLDIDVHVLMGGRLDGRGDDFRRHPERAAIVVGTVDMLLSRALNRGYAMSRFSWPIDFALLHNGAHWVFDEVQLLGPALPTSRQLDALRSQFGTALPSSSTWMSATVDFTAMSTVDRPDVGRLVHLEADDRHGDLARRLDATRRVAEVEAAGKTRSRSLARALVEAHRPGTLTVAVVNTVGAARTLLAETQKVAGPVPVTLLHSRFRPADRRARLDEALQPPGGPGRIVVATQVLEAGVDLSATTMLVEAAPWPSIVQRAGRCNRDGEADDARLLWVRPERPDPYDEADVTAAAEALRGLEGADVTATQLREHAVAHGRAVHPVLRRSDLVALFDTAPDMSGNDVDVAAFIRPNDQFDDVFVAWRDLGGQPPRLDEPQPTIEELCPVPWRQARELMKRAPLWQFDHRSLRRRPGGRGEVQWDRVGADGLRAGLRVIVDARGGGYTPDSGWDPRSTSPVTPLSLGPGGERDTEAAQDVGGDPGTFRPGTWVKLDRHLQDVEREVRRLVTMIEPPGLDADQLEATAVAGRYHDIGKAHDVFQRTMARAATEDQRARVERGVPWAKSGGRARHERRYFRHELASALVLLGDGRGVLAHEAEPDLIAYLVGCHHGRVRLSIRSLPEEQDGLILGIHDGDVVPAVQVAGRTIPEARLSLAPATMGRGPDGEPSWNERALALLDRLGPFRLAYLEALVRLADWGASEAETLEESDL